jgi:hypothetical protein
MFLTRDDCERKERVGKQSICLLILTLPLEPSPRLLEAEAYSKGLAGRACMKKDRDIEADSNTPLLYRKSGDQDSADSGGRESGAHDGLRCVRPGLTSADTWTILV